MRKFNRKKWRDLSILACIAFLSTISQQNCAPASGTLAASAAGGVQQGTTATVIDPVKSDVSFSLKEVQLQPTLQQISLEGNCSLDQQDAVLGWEVLNQSDSSVFATGYAKCEDGHFQVDLSPTQDLQCGQAYTVKAQLGYGGAGETTVSRACAPGES